MSQGHSAVDYVEENRKLLTEVQSEQRKSLFERQRKLSEQDAALNIVRATPFGKPLKVCWSLNDAMKEQPNGEM